MNSDLETLVQKWEDCNRCVIGNYAFKHVFGNGHHPAPFLFVGEAPGVSEDVIGNPFVGPSGKLLREALILAGYKNSDYFITNLVACRPTDKLGGKNRAPTHVEIGNCSSRLRAIISLVKPKIIVGVGNVSGAELEDKYSGYHIHRIRHPAFILRNGGRKSSLYRPWIKELKLVRYLKKEYK